MMSDSRYLVKGGSVVTMDPAIGDFRTADVLVEGSKIGAVAPDLDTTDAEVIDARGTVVVPGFVDTHHHQYQTPLRAALPEGTLDDYVDLVIRRMSPVYRPEDVYIAELVASLSQLDAGVTTVVDTSQVSLSPDHSDAAVDGLVAAGRRSVFAYSTLPVGKDHGTAHHVGELERLREQRFNSDDQLVTLGLNAEMLGGFRDEWAAARRLDVPIVAHAGQSTGTAEIVRGYDEGLLGPDITYLHATGLGDDAWTAIRDTGGKVSLAAPIEMTMGHGMPPVLEVIARGMRPALSTDVETTMTADFFTQMRTLYTLQRALVEQRRSLGDADVPDPLTTHDVLGFATVEGARAAHLADRIGTLTPGKEADLALLRADALNVMPARNAVGAVVTLMNPSNVDTVLVAGEVRKRGGALVGVDVAHLRAELEATRDHLLRAAADRQH